MGDAEHIFIPDLGRSRAGEGRFRGIRLVKTHLHQEPLSEEDLTDLIRLRFDLIVALGVTRDGRPGKMFQTHLLPFGAKSSTAPQSESTVHDQNLEFDTFIEALEEEFARRNVGTLDTGNQTRAIAVHVSTPSQDVKPDTALRELGELAMTADVIIMDALIQKRRRYDPKYLVGQGKLNDLLQLTMQLDCELVIFDQSLTPNQVRCISEATDVKVIDRSMLILEIFARRAHTREGKLAVELAQLQYLLPRLAHSNDAFSRLAGGIGGRGPGETKLEIDRRRARERIGSIKKQLAHTEVQRKNRRRRRNHRQVPKVSILGYTNAGKSTMFNAITQSKVLTEDKLFATLDVTTRRIRFPRERELVMTDTVGFIRDLPEALIDAFKATLEESQDADLLIHVVDMADPQMASHIKSVEEILSDMDLLDHERIILLNKADKIEPELQESLCEQYGAYGVSAQNPKTLRPILELIQRKLWQTDDLEAEVSYEIQSAEEERS